MFDAEREAWQPLPALPSGVTISAHATGTATATHVVVWGVEPTTGSGPGVIAFRRDDNRWYRVEAPAALRRADHVFALPDDSVLVVGRHARHVGRAWLE